MSRAADSDGTVTESDSTATRSDGPNSVRIAGCSKPLEPAPGELIAGAAIKVAIQVTADLLSVVVEPVAQIECKSLCHRYLSAVT
jgi:hypothetical protein